MKSYVKFLLVPLVAVSLFSLTGCDNWGRIKKANSIAVVAMSSSSELVEFNSSGEVQSSKENVGVSDITGIFGGLTKGNVVDSAKDIVQKRDQNLKQTQKNADAFQSELLPLIKNALQKGRFTVRNYDVLSNINLAGGDVAVGLVKESGADAIVECVNTLGYVKSDKNFGLSKEFRLAVKTSATFADKEGVIGTKEYYVVSTQARTSDAAVPAFLKEDFDSIKTQLETQIRTDMIAVKLKQ